MEVPFEKDLRQQLEKRLDLIGRDLRLVETEYALPNAHGTRGRVDILARDGHGSWVVIEIKRSESAAREAAHEVMKYTELLCREKKLRPDRIRAVIASTAWEEMRAPISNLVRGWPHDLQPYRLILDSDGVLVDAEPVDLLPAPIVPKVTSHHHLYFFSSGEKRDRGWQRIVDRAAEVGAYDLLGADLRPVRVHDRVPFPHGLYFAIGKMDPSGASPALRAAAEESDGQDHALEYEALRHITRHVFADTAETAYPGVLLQMVDGADWKLERYRTAGAFGDRDLLGTRDLLRDLNGDEDGLGQILYNGSARTRDRGRWPVFLTEYKRSLDGNLDWAVLVDWWLADVAAQPPDMDVVLSVYNPCDLVGALIYGWPDDLALRVPRIFGTAGTRGGPYRTINGFLYWDGRSIPNLRDRVRTVYRDALSWAVARTAGASWEYDWTLLERLGLHYVLIEHIGDNPLSWSEGDEAALWIVRDGQARRIGSTGQALSEEGWNGAYSLPTFLDEHGDQIDLLIGEYRRALGVQPEARSAWHRLLEMDPSHLDEPLPTTHALPDMATEAEPTSDLPGCTVSRERRVPPYWCADALRMISNLSSSDDHRIGAVRACVNFNPAVRYAALLLIEILGKTHPDDLLLPQFVRDLPDLAASATRSDYIVGTCYLVGLSGLRAELRHRAAAQLTAFCHDAGYAEVRRLLPRNGWSWLPKAIRRGAWSHLIATYFIPDASAPVDSRVSAATAFLEALDIPYLPGIAELIDSPLASGAARIRLAVALARRDSFVGIRHLDALANDNTLEARHRNQAAKHLHRVVSARGNPGRHDR